MENFFLIMDLSLCLFNKNVAKQYFWYLNIRKLNNLVEYIDDIQYLLLNVFPSMLTYFNLKNYLLIYTKLNIYLFN